MNIPTKRLFPHPVVWYANDDYSASDFTMELEYEESFGYLRLSYRFFLNNEELLGRIQTEEVQFCVHVECSLSMFRNRYFTSAVEGVIEIPSDKITHKLEILPLLVANRSLTQYQNSKLHEDYQGVGLHIRKGTILGVSDYRYLMIDKAKDELQKKESIFSFVKNQTDAPMQIETNEDRIIIKLKEKDFNHLQILQSSPKYQPVIFSIFVVPALIFALDSILQQEDLEDMQERLWFRSLEKCFRSGGLELTRETILQRTSYSLAQTLLEDPISKALLVLNDSGGDYT